MLDCSARAAPKAASLLDLSVYPRQTEHFGPRGYGPRTDGRLTRGARVLRAGSVLTNSHLLAEQPKEKAVRPRTFMCEAGSCVLLPDAYRARARDEALQDLCESRSVELLQPVRRPRHRLRQSDQVPEVHRRADHDRVARSRRRSPARARRAARPSSPPPAGPRPTSYFSNTSAIVPLTYGRGSTISAAPARSGGNDAGPELHPAVRQRRSVLDDEHRACPPRAPGGPAPATLSARRTVAVGIQLGRSTRSIEAICFGVGDVRPC